MRDLQRRYRRDGVVPDSRNVRVDVNTYLMHANKRDERRPRLENSSQNEQGERIDTTNELSVSQSVRW